MRVITLIENTEGVCGLTPAHGLSFFIETNRHKLLLDLGPSEETLENAKKLGVDLSEAEMVILSHGHYDHSGGILAFAKENPDTPILMRREAIGDFFAYEGEEKGYHYIGIAPEIAALPQVHFLDEDRQIDDEISVFSDITIRHKRPASNGRLYECKGESYEPDVFAHEQYLVIHEDEKLVLFSGCAHNGIPNIMEAFLDLYGRAPDAVVSGFHLMKKTPYTETEIQEICDIADMLKSYDTQYYTGHCTGVEAYERMKEIMGDQLHDVHCGSQMEL